MSRQGPLNLPRIVIVKIYVQQGMSATLRRYSRIDVIHFASAGLHSLCDSVLNLLFWSAVVPNCTKLSDVSHFDHNILRVINICSSFDI